MEILVIGSGVIGLSVAFELALAGHRVRVVTRNYEEGASWIAGGMLAPFSEGLEGDLLKFSVESLKLYPDFLSRLEEVSRISIYFNGNGILRLALDEEELRSIRELLASYQTLGTKFSVLSAEDVLKEEPVTLPVAGGVLFEEEGNVDAEKLMDALLFACENLKVKVVLDEIVDVEWNGNEVKTVKGYKGNYGADFFVFATGAWAQSLLKLPVYPVKGQILKVKGLELEKVYYSRIAYIIPKENHILVGATSEDVGFDGRVTLEGVKTLSDGAVSLIDALKESELLDVKVGFRPATPDDKPILEAGENYTYLLGHYRNGILWTPLSAKLVLDLLERGERSRYFNEFSANRFRS